MTNQRKADYAFWDKIDLLSLGQVDNLWEGYEPLTNNNFHKGIEKVRKRHWLLKEKLFAMGYRGDAGPNSKPTRWNSFPRSVWLQIAKDLGERPPFLYPEERNPKKERRLGSDKDVEIYKAVGDMKSKHKKSLKDAYEQVRRYSDLPNDVSPGDKMTFTAVQSAYKRGRAETKRRGGGKRTKS